VFTTKTKAYIKLPTPMLVCKKLCTKIIILIYGFKVFNIADGIFQKEELASNWINLRRAGVVLCLLFKKQIGLHSLYSFSKK
jgi:hypothetical protein